MSREQLIPIYQFADVRLGAKHVIRFCKGCLQHHYFLVVRKVMTEQNQATIDSVPSLGKCARAEVNSMDEGRLFRVEDNLDMEAYRQEINQEEWKAARVAIQKARVRQ